MHRPGRPISRLAQLVENGANNAAVNIILLVGKVSARCAAILFVPVRSSVSNLVCGRPSSFSNPVCGRKILSFLHAVPAFLRLAT